MNTQHAISFSNSAKVALLLCMTVATILLNHLSAFSQTTVYPLVTNAGSMNPTQKLKITGQMEVQQESTFGKDVFVAKKIFLETFKDLPSQNPPKDYFAIIDGATGQLKKGAETTGPGGSNAGGGAANGLGNTPLAGTFWMVGGNNVSATTTGINTLSTTDYFGVKNLAPLIFITNNLPRVWISEIGNVGIGTNNPTEKLSVEGNLRVSGNITSAGNITANNVSASGLTVTGQTNFDSLKVTSTIRTSRITPLPGDSLIHFGNNTAAYDEVNNRITWTPGLLNTKGFAIGNGGSQGLGLNSLALGTFAKTIQENSIAIGTWVVSNAPNAITIGKGVIGSSVLGNTTPNSLNIGFNSDIPTLFVGASSGVGTTGAVGIRTGADNPKTDVDIRGHVNIQNGNNAAVFYFPNTGVFPNFYFRSDDDPNTYEVASERFFIGGNGNVGVGTTSPGTKLHIESSDNNTTI